MEAVYAAAESQDDIRLQTLLVTTSVDCRNLTGHTALMFASERGDVAAVTMLLSKNADCNAKSNNGNTAAMFAAKKGHVAIVETLVARGANYNAKNNNGDCALIYAATGGRVAVLEYLLSLKALDIDARNNNGDTALMAACRNGHLSTISLLINKNASDQIVNNEGHTAHDVCKDAITKRALENALVSYHSRLADEDAQRRRECYAKLHLYVRDVLNSVREKYISNFKGRLFTMQASRSDLESCTQLEILESYDLLPMMKGLLNFFSSHSGYSTLDKRLMCALANPPKNRASHAKPLMELLLLPGTIFPSQPARREDIHTYRMVFCSAIEEIVKGLNETPTPMLVGATTSASATTT